MVNNSIEQVVDEAIYPSHFDMDHFKTLKSFNDRVNYCKKILGNPIGSGSARTVFGIDSDTVLKLAKNSKGIAQNEVEINASSFNYDVVAKVIEYEPKYLWLETQRAEKITPNQFKQILGFSVDDFGKFIRNYEFELKGKRPIFNLDKNVSEFMWDNEWCNSVRGLIEDTNISAGDLGRISSYGKIGNEVVIIDYGIDDDLLNTFYRRLREAVNKALELKNNNNNLNESKNNINLNKDVLVKQTELNPQFFKDNKLKKIEREKLIGLAKKYINALEIKGLKVKDIVFTGSNANYNYTDESDVDIHILTDYSKLGDNEDLIKDLFMAKKDNWSNKYEVTIHKHPIELFVQDINQPREWSAEYSLIKDKWVKEPKTNIPDINDKEILDMAKEYMGQINDVIKKYNNKNINSDKTLDDLEKIRLNIKNLRTESLNDEKTEFAEGNLVFKLLRNNNYFDKMQEFKKKVYQDQFGLKEGKYLIIKESQYNLIKDKLLTHKNKQL